MKSRSIRTLVFATACVCVVGSGMPVLARPVFQFPPSGEYRVDIDSTSHSSAGATVLEHNVKTDGASGTHNEMRRSLPDGGVHQSPTVNVGPQTQCIKIGSMPGRAILAMPGAATCRSTKPVIGGDTASYVEECSGSRHDALWRRIDDKTWEVRMTTTPTGAPGGMPAATAGAMAPVIKAMEDAIRNGKPEEAAEAREQLAQLKNMMSGASPIVPHMTHTVTQRLTRIADTCSTR